ncbi:histone-lysine N-methyltransferase, H3 lysine-79 specific [Fopius arisanus]|uniref:Histone-lysine N-methyltransferase, H3 lysine-79 specific n=2 Tax=Fopius arisanus TaxID=64838 RepID=A0A9R1TPX7_9HYME|nr:PREDICTED: histone-lysine N-methyltransferase, H3 lysine-79 specific [Fopius arisanus]
MTQLCNRINKIAGVMPKSKKLNKDKTKEEEAGKSEDNTDPEVVLENVTENDGKITKNADLELILDKIMENDGERKKNADLEVMRNIDSDLESADDERSQTGETNENMKERGTRESIRQNKIIEVHMWDDTIADNYNQIGRYPERIASSQSVEALLENMDEKQAMKNSAKNQKNENYADSNSSEREQRKLDRKRNVREESENKDLGYERTKKKHKSYHKNSYSSTGQGHRREKKRKEKNRHKSQKSKEKEKKKKCNESKKSKKSRHRSHDKYSKRDSDSDENYGRIKKWKL